MGSNIIREEIRVLLDTINEQYAVIESYEGAIPKIEIDILKANIRRIYECMNDLDRINGAVKIPELQKTTIIQEVLREKSYTDVKQEPIIPENIKEQETKTVIPEAPVEKLPVKDIAAEKTPVTETPASKVIEEIKPVPVIEKIVEKTTSEEQATDNKIPEVSPPKQETKTAKKDKKAGIDLFAEVQKGTLADTFKTDQKPLHETLSADKPVKPLVEKIKLGSVKDLKSGIGINERFMFINELFKGNMQLYNTAIDQLNSFAVATEAFAYLEELKAANGWENKAESYGLFEEYVMRKFLAG